MTRLQIGTALCLLSLLFFTSPVHSKESILGTARLQTDRPIFEVPATPTPQGGFVAIACPKTHEFEDRATPTTKAVQPLVTARAGETLTLLDYRSCTYDNGEDYSGGFLEVKTSTGIVGFTQLPNGSIR